MALENIYIKSLSSELAILAVQCSAVNIRQSFGGGKSNVVQNSVFEVNRDEKVKSLKLLTNRSTENSEKKTCNHLLPPNCPHAGLLVLLPMTPLAPTAAVNH